MNDRELLEMAAKAAGMGIKKARQAERDAGGYGHVGLWIVDVSTCWNPLEDDGDALRLAVKLGLTLRRRTHQDPTTHAVVIACAWTEDGVAIAHCSESLILGQDQFKATRRAIVRAAAAIGEQMP